MDGGQTSPGQAGRPGPPCFVLGPRASALLAASGSFPCFPAHTASCHGLPRLSHCPGHPFRIASLVLFCVLLQKPRLQKYLPTGMNGKIGLPCWNARNGCRYSFVTLEPFLPYQMLRMQPFCCFSLPASGSLRGQTRDSSYNLLSEVQIGLSLHGWSLLRDQSPDLTVPPPGAGQCWHGGALFHVLPGRQTTVFLLCEVPMELGPWGFG